MSLENALRASGCPPEYARFTRASWEAKYGPWEDTWHKHLIGWPSGVQLFDGEQFVVFYGLYGRRKTGLATAILGEAIGRGMKGLWIDANAWLGRLKRDRFADFDMQWRKVRSADILVVDDFASVIGGRLTSRTDPAWTFEQLSELARYRYAYSKPTVWTMNIEKLSDLEQVDGSLPSRFDSGKKYKLAGPDYRSGVGP